MRVRRSLGFAAFAVMLLVVAYYGATLTHWPPQEPDLARSRLSEGGLYRVEITPEVDPVMRGLLHGWFVRVTLVDGAPVDNAAISVSGGMPRHGHGLPTAPKVTDHLGDGTYKVQGVRFNMGGWWELEFAISSPAGEDAVVFNLVLDS